jgi:hypothetical protein
MFLSFYGLPWWKNACIDAVQGAGPRTHKGGSRDDT